LWISLISSPFSLDFWFQRNSTQTVANCDTEKVLLQANMTMNRITLICILKSPFPLLSVEIAILGIGFPYVIPEFGVDLQLVLPWFLAKRETRLVFHLPAPIPILHQLTY